jgi:PAS domain S-box-containing protein
MSGLTNGGRERAYQALRESEALHRATLSNISDAVFMADDAGAFTYICPNVDIIFGYLPDEVQAMGVITTLLGDDLFDPAELLVRGEIRNVEREVTSKSGERRNLLIHFKRVTIQNGTLLCTCRDITELRHAERELAVARLELSHAARLALVGELTASIMHEIGQPLAAIQANASAGARLVQEGAKAPDLKDIGEIFRDIRDESGSVAQIVERLRTLLRKRPLERRALDVNGVVNDVVRLIAAEANRRGVALRAELMPLPALVMADRVSLQQVFLNLIVNGMDALEHGTGQARQVLVSTRLEGGFIVVTVRDTGQGIAAADLPRVFDAFFSTKQEGIGLGLAITRSIIEAHSGRISAENDPRGGAAFHVSLPPAPTAMPQRSGEAT